jgi:hypothetical protein
MCIFCDHCGNEIRNRKTLIAMHRVPVDITSALAGESATLCIPCFADIMQADALIEQAQKIIDMAAGRSDCDQPKTNTHHETTIEGTP